jgi:5,10-methylene-tetrahydrofolate dehydrogenase/methenyl tetrahydrofolate cyclohydrolase
MYLHRVSLFGIVRLIKTTGFTNGYRSECARVRQIIIVKRSSIVGSPFLPLLPLASSSDEASVSSFDEEEEATS